jgi:DNA-directed RNA polymerase subunit E'/Rpb7
MSKLFVESVLTRRMHFGITEIQNDDFHQFIERQAKNKFESICIDEGFVKPNSLKVVTISTGFLNKTKISFDVTFECEIFLPMNDAIINCKAVSCTRAGIRAVSSTEEISPFVAFITREHNLSEIIKIEKDEKFSAIILASRYELNDKQVSIIGKFIKRKRKEQEDDEEEGELKQVRKKGEKEKKQKKTSKE